MRIRGLLLLAVLAGIQTDGFAEPPVAPQALVKIKVLEVDPGKLQKLGLAVHTPAGVQAIGPEQLLKTQVIGKNDPLHGCIRACEEQSMAKIVAEPTLALLLGNPTHFTSGGEFPVPAGPDGKEVIWRRYGTEAEVTAHARGEDQVEITFQVRLSEIDKAHEILVAEKKVPGLTTFEVATTCQLPWNDTLLLGSMIQKTANNHEVMRIVLVTPSRLDAATANRSAIQPGRK